MKIEKVAIVTLGCRVNQYESEAIAHDFETHGYEVVRNKKDADIIVVKGRLGLDTDAKVQVTMIDGEVVYTA